MVGASAQQLCSRASGGLRTSAGQSVPKCCVWVVACRSGIIECPTTADVQMLKRLFQYQAHNKLLPALQVSQCASESGR